MNKETATTTRLKLYAEQGVLEESVIEMRKTFGIGQMRFEDDFIQSSPVDDRNIGIVTHSNWYCSLSEDEERNLIEAIARELQRLELPLSLIEQYLEALAYGKTDFVEPLLPQYYIYFMTMLKDSFPANHRTEDKQWLSFHSKHIFGIPTKGRVPKNKTWIWNKLKEVIFDKKPQQQFRSLKNMKAKELALKEKGERVEWIPEASIEKKIKETDNLLVAESYDDFERDKQNAQNVRKHREREYKRLHKVKSKK